MPPSRRAIRAIGFVKNSPFIKEEYTHEKANALDLGLILVFSNRPDR